MENQKITNLLDKDDTDSKHFATKNWYIVNDENNTNYELDKNTGNQICVIMQKRIFWLMVLLGQLVLIIILD